MVRFYISCISFIFWILSINPISAQLSTKMLCPMSYGYVGLSNTHTLQGNGSVFNGFGPMAGVQF